MRVGVGVGRSEGGGGGWGCGGGASSRGGVGGVGDGLQQTCVGARAGRTQRRLWRICESRERRAVRSGSSIGALRSEMISIRIIRILSSYISVSIIRTGGI